MSFNWLFKKGMCHLPVCSNNYHCPPGSKCINRQIKYIVTMCLGNFDCPNGQSCHVEGCKDGRDPCILMDCGASCSAGRCWSDTCTEHSDCPMFKKCLNGKCQDEELDTPCQNFNGCSNSGEMCYFGKCIVNKCINSLSFSLFVGPTWHSLAWTDDSWAYMFVWFANFSEQ